MTWVATPHQSKKPSESFEIAHPSKLLVFNIRLRSVHHFSNNENMDTSFLMNMGTLLCIGGFGRCPIDRVDTFFLKE